MQNIAAKPSENDRLEIRHDGDLVMIRFPRGRVDGSAVTELFEAASQVVAGRGAKLLVDLSGVNHVNSGGVGIMVTLQRRAMTQNVAFHLAIPSEKVRETFEVMHLHRVLSIFHTVDEALAAFKPEA
jgi:anti-sigma B factor antagonist